MEHATLTSADLQQAAPQTVGMWGTKPGEQPDSLAAIPSTINQQTLLQALSRQMDGSPRPGERKVDLRAKVGGVGGRLLAWEYIERTRKSMGWNVPSLRLLADTCRGKAMLICGGGPSLKYDLDKVRYLQRLGGVVVTVNKTYEYFMGLPIEQGGPIIPDFHVLLDPMPWVANYVVTPNPHTKFLVAASCDPAVIRRIRLRGGDCYLWHAGADFYGQEMPYAILKGEFGHRTWSIVTGQTTVGLRSIPLGYELGMRVFHMFGLDSSMAQVDGEFKLHAYVKDRPADADEGTVTLKTKRGSYDFYTNTHMSRQVTDFQDLLEQVLERIQSKAWELVDIRIWGKGMLPTYAASIGMHGDPAMNMEYAGVRDASAYQGQGEAA